MDAEPSLGERVERAADAVGAVWPLYSFVTANPLSGFEDRPFHEAVRAGERLHAGRGYPSADVFRRAWADGRIDADALGAELAAHGHDPDPEASLEALADREQSLGASADHETAETATDRVDRLTTKWLGAFLDQGTAHWSMPNRERGFYAAVRAVAPHDREFPETDRLTDLPDDPEAALAALLSDHPRERWDAILESQLAALPGWTGFVKRRVEAEDAWASRQPITLSGYLAVRLALSAALDAPLAPSASGPDRPADGEPDEAVPLAEAWLSAWETTYRRELVGAVAGSDGDADDATAATAGDDGDADDATTVTAGDDGATAGGRPDAQLAFCIDTRSEILRRHVEAAGDYETYGYAGFFGIPMRHDGYDDGPSVAAHPPIVDAEARVAERPAGGADEARQAHDRWSSIVDAGRAAIDSLASNAATAFSFVESAGAGYGAGLVARTLLPGQVGDRLAAVGGAPDPHEFCEPTLDRAPEGSNALPEGFTLDERVEYAAAAFELTGWAEFARVVAFVGHASQTANNPFDSSLDCGACAGNPGGPNARVLAAICNDEAVRSRLRERGIEIPADTVFVAGEHTTTTDEVELYDGPVPESHAEDLERLRADLAAARAGAAAERAGDAGERPESGVREAERRAADWAETRPEWGLAGNAGFVIGPRGLTADLDLDGRAFLHSYDPSADPDGDALEAILTGPLVVTQWINTQYYFATVDNGVYGAGSKVTHNPVGNVGVLQGNGGDLMAGLPRESVLDDGGAPYHQPLRLSAVVYAPVERVDAILGEHAAVAELLDNGWCSLTVIDPLQDDRALRYAGGEWTPVLGRSDAEGEAEPARPTTDD